MFASPSAHGPSSLRSSLIPLAVVVVALFALLAAPTPASAHDETDGSTVVVVDARRVVVTAAVPFADLGYTDTSGDGLIGGDELREQETTVAPTLVTTARESVSLSIDGEPAVIIGAGVPSPSTTGADDVRLARRRRTVAVGSGARQSGGVGTNRGGGQLRDGRPGLDRVARCRTPHLTAVADLPGTSTGTGFSQVCAKFALLTGASQHDHGCSLHETPPNRLSPHSPRDGRRRVRRRRSSQRTRCDGPRSRGRASRTARRRRWSASRRRLTPDAGRDQLGEVTWSSSGSWGTSGACRLTSVLASLSSPVSFFEKALFATLFMSFACASALR